MTRRDDDSGTGEDTEASDSDPADRPPRSGRERPPSDATPDADPASPTDPRRIRSLAVTESDVVDALEATARGGREIVLRVTPPFSGRMRARLHDAGAVDGDDESGGVPERAADSENGETRAADTGPVHVPPERFVADPPVYPTVDDTEDELRASETPYTRERHRARHQAAVEEWRQAVRRRLVESVAVSTDVESTTVSVSYLG